MRRKNRHAFFEAGEDERLDLTPLIDVVFVVLILFILIAPMIDFEQVDLASAPRKELCESAALQQDHPLTICVKQDNTILVNKHPIPEEKLKPLLHALYHKNPSLTPQLFHDRKGYFGTYQTVKNALEEAGYKKLDVILESGP